MKLFYIVNARIPTEKAHGLQIVKMCEAFAELGLDVMLVVPLRIQTRNMRGVDVFKYYGVKRIFQLIRLPVPDLIRVCGYMPDKAGTLIFHVHGMIFSILAMIYLVFRDAGLIFTRDSKVAFLLSFFRPVIYESHVYPSSKIDQLFEKAAFKRCKYFIAITEHLKEVYVKNGFDSDKIHVLHDGVDIGRFDIKISKRDARRKLGLDINSKLVVYTGHLYPWKGVYTLIDAAKYIDAEVILVGGLDEDVKNARRYVSENRIRNVKIAGHVEPWMVPLYLKAADVLVLPNSARDVRSRYYTSPMKLFEYMASRRPIVASDLPSIREILSEKSAVLVEPDNPEALAEGINKILDDKNAAESIAERAYNMAKRYTWKNRAKSILKICAKSGITQF